MNTNNFNKELERVHTDIEIWTTRDAIANHEHLMFIRNGEKVRWTLTNTTQPSTEAVKKHLKSKSYKKAMWYAHIIQSTNLILLLTKRFEKVVLHNDENDIEQYTGSDRETLQRKEIQEKKKGVRGQTEGEEGEREEKGENENVVLKQERGEK